MVGTANVAAGGGESSGVDFTEYRIDSDDPGDWVQSQNDGGDDPFVTEFTVSDEGAHEVDFRSVDNAGNEEEVSSVAFAIEGDEGAPELGLSVRPKRKTVKAGERATFTATATNTGDAQASQVRVCARAPKGKARVVGKACATAASLAAGAKVAPKFKIKPTRKARGKRVRVTFTATAQGLPTIRTNAVLKVAKR